MKSTLTDTEGTVRCPRCGATSFSPQHTKKAKIAFGFASLLAAPKLRCNGCGEYLKPGRTSPPAKQPALGELTFASETVRKAWMAGRDEEV